MRPLHKILVALLLTVAPVVHAEPAAPQAQAHPAPAAQAAQLGRRVLSKDWQAPRGGKAKVAFFDADSTLRISPSGGVSAQHPTDVKLLPGVVSRIKQLNAEGYLVAIVSNQGGVGQYISLADADAALAYTGHLIAKEGGRVDYYDFAEHNDVDRKPSTGMAQRLEGLLATKHGLQLDKGASFMVGDSGWKMARYGQPADVRPDGKPGTAFSNADRLFAESYQIPFREAPHYFVGPLQLK